jgi:hypothetical protein
MNATIRWVVFSLATAILIVSDLPAIAQEGATGPPTAAPAPLPQREVCRYGVGNPTAYRYAAPYIAAYVPPAIAGRILDRLAFGPLAASSPYPPYSNQPIGHEKIWTSPNSYVYRPLYAGAPGAIGSPAAVKPGGPQPGKLQTPTLATPRTPTLAEPSTRPGAVQAGFAAPAADGLATTSVPEVIPTPPPVGSPIKGGPTMPAPPMPAEEGLHGPHEF